MAKLKTETEWRRNIWTGNDILDVNATTRIIRTGDGKSHVYRAEYWGDHSLRFPVKGPFRTSLVAAKRDGDKLAKENST